MTEMLKDTENYRAVIVSRCVGRSSVFQEVLVEMTEGEATLLRLREEGKAKSFHLTAPEMDTLAEAWVQFRAKQKERREAEERRLAEEWEQLKARVAALGGTVALVHQESDGSACYDVAFTDHWAHCSMRSAGQWRIKERVEEIEHTLACEARAKATSSSASNF